jgi:hypothetical protein
VPDLPRTKNDLDQFFGAYRYHDRRTTGRKVASPALVLNSAVGVIAAAATRRHIYFAAELAPENISIWQALGGHGESAAARSVADGAFAVIQPPISQSLRRTSSS